MKHGHAAAHMANATEHREHFWRHFLEMLAVMLVGMFVAGYILVRASGFSTWNDTIAAYPTLSLLVMAAGMSLPMVTWMLFRGMGGRNSSEMAAAMILPVVPFLLLVWFGITKSPLCGGYCAASVVAMLGLMLYRRDAFSMAM
jgi:hypothetical protein